MPKSIFASVKSKKLRLIEELVVQGAKMFMKTYKMSREKDTVVQYQHNVNCNVM